MELNIGWISAAAYATTGYGRMCKEIVARLIAKNVNVINIGGIGGTTVWGGKLNYPVTIIDKNSDKEFDYDCNEVKIPVIPTIGHMAGADVVPMLIKKYGLNLLIAHWDCFAINYLQKLKTPSIVYIPVDAPFTKRMWMDVNKAHKIVLFSKYGYQELLKFTSPDHLDYIPHGINTSEWVMYNDKKRADLAKKFFGSSDSFNILTVGANVGERKQLPFMILTFKRWLKTEPNSKLFIFSNPSVAFPKGYDLLGFVAQLGLQDKVFFPKFDPIIEPWPNNLMCELYNAADVYLTTTLGEGFGVPLLESMACGTPVIGPRNSTIPELVSGHGYIYDCVHDYRFVPVWVPTLQTYPVPSMEDLFYTLKHVHKYEQERYENSIKAKQFAQQYDWKKIMPLWHNLLKKTQDQFSLI